MDFILLFIFATVCGLFFSVLGLPAMVGFLFAGFLYNFLGLESPVEIEFLSEIGINLLLFSIGLKLKLNTLIKKEVYGTAFIEVLLFILLATIFLYLCNQFFFSPSLELTIYGIFFVAFILSFSSTVYAVKTLQNKGDITAFYGQTAIGILIVQDLIASFFLVLSEGKYPEYYAIVILILPLIKPLIYKFLDLSGHDELLVFSGLILALGLGAELFKFVGLKGELGALLIGVLVSSHYKADELSKSLFSIKEFFIVGFFLSIGLNGAISFETIFLGLVLCFLLPLKVISYFVVCNYFRLRSRTSLFSSFSLSTYSEFALILGAIAAGQNIISFDWLVVIAIAVSLSFAFASPLSKHSEKIYEYFKFTLLKYQSKEVHEEDLLVEVGEAKALVVGMGRVGVGAYDELKTTFKSGVVGIEHDSSRVKKLVESGRKVLIGDADDYDFWLNLKKNTNLEYIVLAMPRHRSNLAAAQQINHIDLPCKVSAVVRFEEEGKDLSTLGVTVFNIYAEAGSGLIKHSLKSMN